MPSHKEKAEQALEALRNQETHVRAVNLTDSPLVEMSAKECAQMCKRIGVEYHDGLEKRIIQYRFTDTTVDRHNEVIKPKGVDLSKYRKDPILCGQHKWAKFNIGKSLQTKYYPEFDDVAGMCMFFDDIIDSTGVSEDFFRMCRSGAMQQGSIGYMARREDIRHPSPEEQEQYKIDKYGYVFDKIELLEFSPVTIPSNPNARQVPSRRKLHRNKTIWHFEHDLHLPENLIKEFKDEDIYIVREGIELDEKRLEYIEDLTELETFEEKNIIEAEKKEKPDSAVVQTLVFSKEVFKTVEEVKKWIKDHPPFKMEKIHETKTSYRIRQRDPAKFDPKSFRTINITKGIQAVIGKLKKDVEPDNTKSETPNENTDATIYIGANDTQEERDNKMKMFMGLKEKGVTTHLKITPPEAGVNNTIIQEPVSKNLKSKIENTLSVVSDLKADLMSLLKSADSSDSDEDDDLIGSLNLEEPYYAVQNNQLGKALEKIKSKTNK